jgi:hypothetical protein
MIFLSVIIFIVALFPVDLTSAKKWFGDCYSLRDLSLTGNPLLQEINWR